MSFQLMLFILISLQCFCQAVDPDSPFFKENWRKENQKSIHWRDLLKNPSLTNEDPKSRLFKNTKDIPKDSHKYLNIRSEQFREPIKNLERYTQAELPPGHTERLAFIPLRNSRDKYENRVTGALAGGVMFSKEKKGVSDALLRYAKEQRGKSLKRQKLINEIVTQGHVNESFLRQDKRKLERANVEEYKDQVNKRIELYEKKKKASDQGIRKPRRQE